MGKCHWGLPVVTGTPCKQTRLNEAWISDEKHPGALLKSSQPLGKAVDEQGQEYGFLSDTTKKESRQDVMDGNTIAIAGRRRSISRLLDLALIVASDTSLLRLRSQIAKRGKIIFHSHVHWNSQSSYGQLSTLSYSHLRVYCHNRAVAVYDSFRLPVIYSRFILKLMLGGHWRPR